MPVVLKTTLEDGSDSPLNFQENCLKSDNSMFP